MKLLLCHKCNDVFSLKMTTRTCDCGRLSGLYVDELNAKVYGTEGEYTVIGFANSTLINAIKQQLEHGDQDGFFGRRFEAFIIPEKAESVKRFSTYPKKKVQFPKL